MDLTQEFFRHFWGVTLILISSTYLLRPRTCEIVLSMMKDPAHVLISAWFSILLGVPTLLAGWGKDRLLLSVGLVFTINGLFRLSFPERVSSMADYFIERKVIPLLISAAALVFGIVLLC